MKLLISINPENIFPHGFKIVASVAFFIMILIMPLYAQWRPDSQLTFDQNLSYTSYNNAWCLAANKDTIHVVWYDDRDNTFWDIYYKRSSDAGITWGPDIRLTNHIVDTYANSPSLAVSGPTVHVVWCDGRDGNPEIYYKRSTNCGATWGSDIRLTGDDSSSYYPSMAVDGAQIHVVWRDNRDTTYEIYYKRSQDNGASWGPDARLTSSSGNAWYSSVAVSGNVVHVAWFDDRDGNPEIYYKRSTDGGATWGDDIRMTNAPWNSDFTSIAASGTDVHIVWRDYRDGNFEIYHKRSTDAGITWGLDQRLTSNDSVSTFPSVAVSGSNVHVVWNDNRAGANMEIYYKMSKDRGTTWTSDTKLTAAIRFSRKPSIALSGPSVHVVWEDNRTARDNFEIFYKCNPTGNLLGVEENTACGSQIPRGRLNSAPNPFVSYTTIPGHEKDSYALYDMAGRHVKTYKGNHIGDELTAGVYFLYPVGKNVQPVRIVKIR